MSSVIYVDHNAKTPVLPEILEVMMPYLTTEWGNPSGGYKISAKIKSVIETAREQAAELIGAHSAVSCMFPVGRELKTEILVQCSFSTPH